MATDESIWDKSTYTDSDIPGPDNWGWKQSYQRHFIDSLDETVDEGAEEAWATEVAQRLKGLREGRVELIPWSEARRRIAGR
jgi:Putative addiction module component